MSTTTPIAAQSGTFDLGASTTVRRLGYGTMQLTGPGVWGDPKDPAEAVRVLRRAVELGVTFIDTADSYGPFVAELLIKEALHPYSDELVIATKAGLTRSGPGDCGRSAGPSTCASRRAASVVLTDAQYAALSAAVA
ncbi:MAG TPA: aldo/keto reductase [Solirubrobacteraceae bacterium]|jgi:aryl-alcohol dehydrogenase-like predicted oxidoreductase